MRLRVARIIICESLYRPIGQESHTAEESRVLPFSVFVEQWSRLEQIPVRLLQIMFLRSITEPPSLILNGAYDLGSYAAEDVGYNKDVTVANTGPTCTFRVRQHLLATRYLSLVRACPALQERESCGLRQRAAGLWLSH